jgi:hypothetical protein
MRIANGSFEELWCRFNSEEREILVCILFREIQKSPMKNLWIARALIIEDAMIWTILSLRGFSRTCWPSAIIRTGSNNQGVGPGQAAAHLAPCQNLWSAAPDRLSLRLALDFLRISPNTSGDAPFPIRKYRGSSVNFKGDEDNS